MKKIKGQQFGELLDNEQRKCNKVKRLLLTFLEEPLSATQICTHLVPPKNVEKYLIVNFNM